MLRSLYIVQPFLRCRSSVIYSQQCNVRQSVEEKLGLPEKPKKPPAGFVRFMNNCRSDIISKNPQAGPREIVKIGSELWKSCSEATKNRLKEEYKKDFEKYATQIQKYNESLTSQQREEIKEAVEEIKDKKEKRSTKTAESKRNKELGKPVKPVSSFLLFAQKEAPNRGNRSVKDFQVYLAQKWMNLPEDVKNKFSNDAAKAKAAYEKKLMEWEKKMLALGNFDVVRQKTLSEKKEKKE